MKYIIKFATEAEYNAASADLPTPNIILIEENMGNADGGIILNKYVEPTHNYANDYLTIVAQSDGFVRPYMVGNRNNAYYSVDGGETWTKCSDWDIDDIPVSNGDRVLFKNTTDYVDTDSNNTIQVCDSNYDTAPCILEGNIMSFIYGDNFVGQTTFPSVGGYVSPFGMLFGDCNITDLSNLVIPATVIPTGYFTSTFKGTFNSITCLATTIDSVEGPGWGWLGEHPTATGTFTKAAGVTWPIGINGIPTGWTVVEV